MARGTQSKSKGKGRGRGKSSGRGQKKVVKEAPAKVGAQIRFKQAPQFEANFFQVGGPGSRGGPGAYKRNPVGNFNRTNRRNPLSVAFPNVATTNMISNPQSSISEISSLKREIKELREQKVRPAQSPININIDPSIFRPANTPPPLRQPGQVVGTQTTRLRQPPNLPRRRNRTTQTEPQRQPQPQPQPQPSTPAGLRRRAEDLRRKKGAVGTTRDPRISLSDRAQIVADRLRFADPGTPPPSPPQSVIDEGAGVGVIPEKELESKSKFISLDIEEETPQPRKDIPQPTPQPIQLGGEQMDFIVIPQDISSSDLESITDSIQDTPSQIRFYDSEEEDETDYSLLRPPRNIPGPSQAPMTRPPVIPRDDDPQSKVSGLDYLAQRYEQIYGRPPPRTISNIDETLEISKDNPAPNISAVINEDVATQTDDLPKKRAVVKGPKISSGTQTETTLPRPVRAKSRVKPDTKPKSKPQPLTKFFKSKEPSPEFKESEREIAEATIFGPERKKQPIKDDRGEVDLVGLKTGLDRIFEVSRDKQTKKEVQSALDDIISTIEQGQAPAGAQGFKSSQQELSADDPLAKKQIGQLLSGKKYTDYQELLEKVARPIRESTDYTKKTSYSDRRGRRGRPRITFSDVDEEALKLERKNFNTLKDRFKSEFNINIVSGLSKGAIKDKVNSIRANFPDRVEEIDNMLLTILGNQTNIKKLEARRRKK